MSRIIGYSDSANHVLKSRFKGYSDNTNHTVKERWVGGADGANHKVFTRGIKATYLQTYVEHGTSYYKTASPPAITSIQDGIHLSYNYGHDGHGSGSSLEAFYIRHFFKLDLGALTTVTRNEIGMYLNAMSYTAPGQGAPQSVGIALQTTPDALGDLGVLGESIKWFASPTTVAPYGGDLLAGNASAWYPLTNTYSTLYLMILDMRDISHTSTRTYSFQIDLKDSVIQLLPNSLNMPILFS